MAKVKRYNGQTGDQMTDEDVRSFAGIPENDSNAGMASEAGMMEKEPEENFKAAPKAKAPIVTKEQLAAFQRKYGADKTLRDYMNDQKGLTRRGEKASDSSSSSSKAAPKSEAAKAETPKTTTTKSSYETPYDRMNRTNREAEAAKRDAAKEVANLRSRHPAPGRGVIDTKNINPNTLLPNKMARGGMTASRRADGIAQRGKTRGKMC